jgi:transcriptional regulator with XRE-family HTH domain
LLDPNFDRLSEPIQTWYYPGMEASLADGVPASGADPRRSELGDFLRSRRERLNPKFVGLVAGKRRRTAGLRREEVAERAGIGVDWYTRLEQGRSVSPSATTIDALARALGLSKAEHEHLRALSRQGGRRAFTREVVPATVRRVVESLNQPAYLTGRRWDVLAWNAAAAELFAFDRVAPEDRNTLVSVLTNPNTRRLFGPTWEGEARRMVAEFRATHDLWSGDPAFVALLERLGRGCAEFAGWWEAHDVRGVAAGRKRLQHPKRGLLTFEYASFQANDDPALKLVVYTQTKSDEAG